MSKLRNSPTRITQILVAIAVYILIQSLIVNYISLHMTNTPRFLKTLAGLVHSGIHGALPTYFSIGLLIAATLILMRLTYIKFKTDRVYMFHWGILSLVLLGLTLEKSFKIADLPLVLIKSIIGEPFYNEYRLIIWSVVIVLGGLFFVRFILHFDRKTQFWLFASGVTYIWGAFIMDNFMGKVWHRIYESDTAFLISTSTEEFFEMLGIILLIYILLTYLQNLTNPQAEEALPQIATEERQQQTHGI